MLLPALFAVDEIYGHTAPKANVMAFTESFRRGETRIYRLGMVNHECADRDTSSGKESK